MSEIRFIDTTVRDGHLSLWALGMRSGHMLGAARQMDRCGFESMEFFGFASIIKQVREHKENPWDWVRLGVKQFSRTRLRYHGGLGSGFEPIPSCVLRLVMERVIAHGITLTRSSNPWNDYGVGRNSKCGNCMVHCGFEPTAVNDAVAHPLKALKVSFRGPRTDGAMVPDSIEFV